MLDVPKLDNDKSVNDSLSRFRFKDKRVDEKFALTFLSKSLSDFLKIRRFSLFFHKNGMKYAYLFHFENFDWYCRH